MRRRSPRRCCGASRRKPWSLHASGLWKVPSAWSTWRWAGSPKRPWSNWTRSAKPRWSPICSSCCAASTRPSRWSTREHSTSEQRERDVVERKTLLLRLDPAVHDALARWAADELRSTNAQIEFLLRRALAEAARLPESTGRLPRRGRPPKLPDGPARDGDAGGCGL